MSGAASTGYTSARTRRTASRISPAQRPPGPVARARALRNSRRAPSLSPDRSRARPRFRRTSGSPGSRSRAAWRLAAASAGRPRRRRTNPWLNQLSAGSRSRARARSCARYELSRSPIRSSTAPRFEWNTELSGRMAIARSRRVRALARLPSSRAAIAWRCQASALRGSRFSTVRPARSARPGSPPRRSSATRATVGVRSRRLMPERPPPAPGSRPNGQGAAKGGSIPSPSGTSNAFSVMQTSV